MKAGNTVGLVIRGGRRHGEFCTAGGLINRNYSDGFLKVDDPVEAGISALTLFRLEHILQGAKNLLLFKGKGLGISLEQPGQVVHEYLTSGIPLLQIKQSQKQILRSYRGLLSVVRSFTPASR